MPMPRSMPFFSLSRRRFLNDDHSAAAMQRSITSSNSPVSSTSLVADVYGMADGVTRRGVDQALEEIGGFRPAGAPIGANRHRVGGDAFDVDVDGAERIEAGDEICRARRHEAAERREVSADIGEDRNPQAEEAAF